MKYSLSFPTEATANGHGNENSFDAGRIALVESWAEHIGWSFAHMTYGTNVSMQTFANYQIYLENQRNEETNHIPIGYYYDLIDGVNITEIANDFDDLGGVSGTIVDEVSGFTNAQLFSLLTSSTTSPVVYNASLISSGFIQSPNTTQGANALFISY